MGERGWSVVIILTFGDAFTKAFHGGVALNHGAVFHFSEFLRWVRCGFLVLDYSYGAVRLCQNTTSCGSVRFDSVKPHREKPWLLRMG